VTKTCAAFTLSARQLCEKYPRLYFWTVTFCTLHDDWEASRLFSAFLHHLQDVVGKTGWGGLRVVELHKEHGVHYHLLVTERLAVDIVRRVGRCYGIGRVQVDRVRSEDYEDAIKYLAKYLSKQREAPKTQSGRNMRRWAAFGDVPRVRVSDMVNDSPMWVYRREKQLPWLHSFEDEKVIERCWDHGPEAFRAAWFACRRQRGSQDARAIAEGRIEVRDLGEMVESFRSAESRSKECDCVPF